MPSWGYWIKMGATTLYESWIEAGTLEQRANNAGSLNHIMLGSQMDWYYKVSQRLLECDVPYDCINAYMV
jgi:hypothetical protein